MTPYLPRMGKQPKGSIPLTPSYCGVYFKVTGFYRNRGMPKRRGRTHEKQKPQERLFIFERISTKPIFLKNAFFNSFFFKQRGIPYPGRARDTKKPPKNVDSFDTTYAK
jgi:hypothetical protein